MKFFSLAIAIAVILFCETTFAQGGNNIYGVTTGGGQRLFGVRSSKGSTIYGVKQSNGARLIGVDSASKQSMFGVSAKLGSRASGVNSRGFSGGKSQKFTVNEYTEPQRYSNEDKFGQHKLGSMYIPPSSRDNGPRNVRYLNTQPQIAFDPLNAQTSVPEQSSTGRLSEFVVE